MLTLTSEKFGPIKFSSHFDFEEKRRTMASISEDSRPEYSISIQTLVLSDFRAELMNFYLKANDKIHFSDMPVPYTLLFVFGHSVSVFLNKRLKKDIHDRGGHLFHTEHNSYTIRFEKDKHYILIFIHYTNDFVMNNIEKEAQSIRMNWELQSPVFYYSRSRITRRDTMELLSMLMKPVTPEMNEDFWKNEIARTLLLDFLSEKDILFQPDYLKIEQFDSFYLERDALVGQISVVGTLPKLLSLAHIRNTPVFRKRLKQLYGLNIREFITEIRMENAKTLLREPSLSIKEIANITGFASAFYFSRVFTNYFGLPPKSFHAKRTLQLKPPIADKK